MNRLLRSNTQLTSFLVGLSFLAAACSGEGDPGDREDSGAFDEIEGMEARSGQPPITPHDLVVIQLAEQRLVAACLADEGFDYGVTVEAVTRYTVPSAPRFLSPDELRRRGYQYDWDAAAESFLAANAPGGPPDPAASMSDVGQAAYMQAMAGDPDDVVVLDDAKGRSTVRPASGCLAEARIELYGGIENSIRFDRAIETLSGDGLSRKLQQYNSYQAPLDAWLECMRAAGHDVFQDEEEGYTVDYGFVHLRSAQLSALASGGSPPTAEQIQLVADADADCQESAGLYEVRQELLPEAEDELAAELGLEMSQYIAFQHAVLERAQRVP
jgi:hypothetical protein